MPETLVPYPTALTKFPRVRQSLLATFDQCALLSKFDQEYRKGWSGHPQGRGQIFHRFASKALLTMNEHNERHLDPEDGLTILRECLRQHDVEDRDVVTIPFSQIKDLRWVVIKFCNDNVFDVQFLAEIEQRFRGKVAYPNEQGELIEREITGALDALFIPEPDWAVVLDWKDTWSLPPESEMSEGGYFQQRFYALLVFLRYPAIQRVTLREFYVRYSEPREATVFRSELPNITDEIAALVERFDRAVEHGTWPLPAPPANPVLWSPSPGAHCGWCPRPGACPIFPDARVQGAITDAETAERWAAEQIVAKAAVSQRDKALRAWAGHAGSIPIKHAKDPNRVLGYRSTTRTSRPTKEQLEAALALEGADLNPEGLYKEATSTRFEAHSAGESENPPDAADDVGLVAALEESIRRQAGPEDGEDAGVPPPTA